MNNPNIRNWHAVAAWNRNGGPMKDRRQPRGGSRNDQRDMLLEVYLEEESTEDEGFVLARSSSSL